jgi:hypothetical protein
VSGYHATYHAPGISSTDYRDLLEYFPSLGDAKEALKARYEVKGGRDLPTTPVIVDHATGEYETGEPARSFFEAGTPEDTYMDLYQPGSDYPDKRLTVGPRGGVTVTSH